VTDEIRTLWNAHRQAKLPDVPRERMGELWVLDEVIGGCVAFYLNAGGMLDPPRIAVLEDCRADLDRLMPDLEEAATSYFGRLGTLAGLLIETSKKTGGCGETCFSWGGSIPWRGFAWRAYGGSELGGFIQIYNGGAAWVSG
jgi:hypothetical protein